MGRSRPVSDHGQRPVVAGSALSCRIATHAEVDDVAWYAVQEMRTLECPPPALQSGRKAQERGGLQRRPDGGAGWEQTASTERLTICSTTRAYASRRRPGRGGRCPGRSWPTKSTLTSTAAIAGP